MAIGPGLFDINDISYEYEIQNHPNMPPTDCHVDVAFAGSGLRKDLDLGAAPVVNLTREFIRDGGGSFVGMNNRVTLQGKIFPTGGQLGISGTLMREKRLKDLFSKSVGDLKIIKKTAEGTSTQAGEVMFSGINAKVMSYTANQTPDNWTTSIDYSIDLEFFEEITESPIDATNYRVSSVTENWSIEPQEMIYSSLGFSITKQPEIEPSESSDGTAGNAQSISKSISLSGIPQFRITRQLSAVGIPSSGFVSHIGKHSENSQLLYNYVNRTDQNSSEKTDAYLNAKKWVEDRSRLAFSTTHNTNGQYSPFLTMNNSALSSYNDIHLYNHTKTVNFSITDGSYETTDSWLAIPCGIYFTEEYTIESSTDERFVRTVAIQGSVNGLSVPQFDNMEYATGLPNTGSSIGKLGLKDQYNRGGLNGSSSDFGHFNTNTVNDTKYANALSGFIKNVKPFLYERSCLAVNTFDRTQDYNPSTTITTQNPGNPAFRKERRLNYIPVSTSEGHDPLKGIISYNYQYNNKTKIFSGVIAEAVDISVNGPGDVVNEAFVLGRPLGPVLQSLNTKTATTKNVSIELTVVPPSTSKGFLLDNTDCPLYTGGNLFKQVEDLVEGLKPFGEVKSSVFYGLSQAAARGNVFVKSNTYGWNPIEGKYTRNIEWVYQPCSLSGSTYDKQFLSRTGT